MKILPFCDNKALFNEFILKGDANYACWCGAGTVNAKMFKPQNILDRVCRAHDICYDAVHDMGCHEPYDVDYDWGYQLSSKKVLHNLVFIATILSYWFDLRVPN